MSEPLAGQALNVQDLKRIADEKETAKLQELLTKRRKEEDEEKRARQDFMERELRPDGLERFNNWVRRAAEQGQSEIEIMRFPSQYCTDHGRAINNFEASLARHAERHRPPGLRRLRPASAGAGLQDPRPDPELPGRRPGRGRNLHRLVICRHGLLADGAADAHCHDIARRLPQRGGATFRAFAATFAELVEWCAPENAGGRPAMLRLSRDIPAGAGFSRSLIERRGQGVRTRERRSGPDLCSDPGLWPPASGVDGRVRRGRGWPCPEGPLSVPEVTRAIAPTIIDLRLRKGDNGAVRYLH